MNKQKTIIWDLPTRVFHWLLVISYSVAWISFDDNRFLFVHVYGGYVFLTLLIFRLIWGIIGTHHARFHTFAYDYTSVMSYLKSLLNGSAMRHIGHNPIGGWAIFLMLIVGLLAGITGILVLGGEEGHGPLRHLVSYDIGIHTREFHAVIAWSMLAITIIHILGVVVESIIHKDNLIWAMFTGRKETAAGIASVHGHHLLGISIVTTIFISTIYYFDGYLTETSDNLYQPYKGPELPDNATWRSECSECHFAFHPSLLPERSWRKLFATQHEHFGDDLDLDEETLAELLKFHTENSAEQKLTEPARKILYYTPEEVTPLRVTDTVYWKKKHEDIDDVYWKSEKVKIKGNCNACHLDAKAGTFEDSDMRLPKLEK